MGTRTASVRWMLGLWVLGVAPAPAATMQRDYLSHGVANCHAARSFDEAALHRSPMGVSNIGSKGVFVTCDFDIGPNVPNLDPAVGIDDVTIAFLNPTAVDTKVSCTLASGILHVATHSSKSTVVVGRSEFAGLLSWTAADDNSGNRIPAPALSCVLPPGIEISYILVRATEQVGQ